MCYSILRNFMMNARIYFKVLLLVYFYKSISIRLTANFRFGTYPRHLKMFGIFLENKIRIMTCISQWCSTRELIICMFKIWKYCSVICVLIFVDIFIYCRHAVFPFCFPRIHFIRMYARECNDSIVVSTRKDRSKSVRPKKYGV